ncbi:MAG: ATP-binding cassette domain-containing protein [Nannocystaceae bacterium]|nr:ATP-binding cassette domain-containing protein [Nannocystaceae bacterium]
MSYGNRGGRVTALDEVSFAVAEGAFALLTGPSGAGKSTLLKLVLASERPDRGTIRVAGRDIHRLRKSSIPYLRRNVGAVFQDFKLLPDASPRENVALALQVLGIGPAEVEQRARKSLLEVELDPDTRRPARCLSGGEQQRVAIARALAGDPAILLADEPTGNLDPRLSREILELLQRVCARGTTVMIATHDPLVIDHVAASHRLELARGRLVADSDAVAVVAEPETSEPLLPLQPIAVGAVA